MKAQNDPEATTTTQKDTKSHDGLFPVSGRWLSVAFYLFLFVWGAYMLVETLGYGRREDFLFPSIVLSVTILLLGSQLLLMAFPQLASRFETEGGTISERFAQNQEEMVEAKSSFEQSFSKRPKKKREKYELYMIAWVVALPVVFYYLGMGWTITAYVFALTYFLTRRLRTAAFVTVLVILLVVIIFLQFLNVPIHGGIEWIPSPLDLIDI